MRVRDAVIEAGGDICSIGRAGQGIAARAVDGEAVFVLFDPRASKRKRGRHRGEPIALLDAQFIQPGGGGGAMHDQRHIGQICPRSSPKLNE